MAFPDRIPALYLKWIPIIYFAALGTYDIGSDLLDKRLSTGHFFFNLIFFLPLIPYWLVYLATGVLYAVFAAYVLIVELIFIVQYINGAHFQDEFGTLVIGPVFGVAIMLCALALIYSGLRKKPAALSKQFSVRY